MRIGKFNGGFLGDPCNQISADLAAGVEIILNRMREHGGAERDAAVSQFPDEHRAGFRDVIIPLRFFDQWVGVDDLDQHLDGSFQIGLIGHGNVQERAAGRVAVEIAVDDRASIHFRVRHDDMGRVDDILDDRVPRVDFLNVTGDLFAVDGHGHAVAQLERTEDRQDETVYNVGKPFLKDEAEYDDDQGRRH